MKKKNKTKKKNVIYHETVIILKNTMIYIFGHTAQHQVQFFPTEVIADKNGWYILVMGVLYQTPVLLDNMYAPNFDDVN